MTNLLYYGDNLDILREHVATESVDLIYLDPPFNSNAAYNVLFSAPAGQKSESQVEAFQDTWHCGDSAARAFEDVLRSRHTDVATLSQAMRRFLGESDLMAYLAMMAVPQGGQKKGADRGIDGIRWVRTGPNSADIERVLVSVKGGENLGVAMVRDLKGTMEREGAIGGLFICLAEPTREMRREATASGFFDTGFGTYPRIQIVTIRELLAGMRPDLPPLGRSEGFRRAPRERGPQAKQTDLAI